MANGPAWTGRASVPDLGVCTSNARGRPSPDIREKTPALMDVDLAADLLFPSKICRIWMYLLHESKGKDFFYCESSGAQAHANIGCRDDTETIGKRPVGLPQGLWRLLRSATPISSAAEELSKLFQTAEVCSPPDTIFSRTVQKAIESMFRPAGFDAGDPIGLCQRVRTQGRCCVQSPAKHAEDPPPMAGL
ncbi:unnamed protein product [Penicillium manginii]